MSFVGAGFLAGLLGIALPLAIHLFAKRKRVPMPWGAMRFLSEAKPTWRRRTLRLQDWLVLLLRIAAVALLALAFARPLWERPAPPADGQQWLIVVDRSPSTELGSDGDRIAGQIQQQLADTLAALPETTRLDIFVNGSDHGTGLVRLPPSDGQPFNSARNQKSWLDSLQSLRPGAGTTDWSDAIRSALSFPPIPVDGDESFDTNSRSFANRSVVVIADAAAEAWPFPAPEASDTALAHWERTTENSQGESISVALLPVGSAHADRKSPNLCIDHIAIDPPRATAGETVTLRATITNRGTEPAVPATARWSDSTDSASVSEAEIPDLAPGAAHELVLQREFATAGPAAVDLEIGTSDALSADNQATAIVEIIDRLKIVTVTDEDPARIADNDIRFSHWAFATAAAASGSVFELVPLTINDFANTDLDEIAAVVWSANDRDPAAVKHAAEKLYRFVSHGGGLWLRPPPDINAEAFNEVFFPHDYGLSPAALAVPPLVASPEGQTIGLRSPEAATDRSSDRSAFSTTDGLTRHALSSLAELQATRHLALRQPLPPTTSMLAELEGGKAFIVARQLGRGQVLLTTLDSHPKSANLAACSGYLPMVREMLWQLAGGGLPTRNLAPGDHGPWPQLGPEDAVRLPSGEWISPLPPEASDRRDTPFVAPGLYLADVHKEETEEKRQAANATDSPYAVGRIAEESNLAVVPDSYFETLATLKNISVVEAGKFSAHLAAITQPAPDPIDPLTLNDNETPVPSNATQETEIGAWLLVALLGFLLLELISAQHLLSRRRRASGRS